MFVLSHSDDLWQSYEKKKYTLLIFNEIGLQQLLHVHLSLITLNSSKQPDTFRLFEVLYEWPDWGKVRQSRGSRSQDPRQARQDLHFAKVLGELVLLLSLLEFLTLLLQGIYLTLSKVGRALIAAVVAQPFVGRSCVWHSRLCKSYISTDYGP